RSRRCDTEGWTFGRSYPCSRNGFGVVGQSRQAFGCNDRGNNFTRECSSGWWYKGEGSCGTAGSSFNDRVAAAESARFRRGAEGASKGNHLCVCGVGSPGFKGVVVV